MRYDDFPAPIWPPHIAMLHAPDPGSRIATHFWSWPAARVLARAMGAPPPGLSIPGLDRGARLVMGWGNKASARSAQRFAARRSLPFWHVEDGFFRSVGLGKAGAPSLSYCLDDLAPYYDARVASRLELTLRTAKPAPPELARAARLRDVIVRQALSKYNLPQAKATLPGDARGVLIIDQTAGDLSLEGALAAPDAFARMVAQARTENPGVPLWLKAHPDVVAGLAQSALGANGQGLVPAPPGLTLDTLARGVSRVYTVSSQFGFDALLRGVPVTTFGVPFYAGWGLTQDRATSEGARAALARRSATPLSLDALTHGALIAYPVYLDPLRGDLLSPELALERLRLWREQASRLPRAGDCLHFSAWKRPHVATYLRASGALPRFPTAARALFRARPGHGVLTWGMKADTTYEADVRERGADFFRVEDGFVRSVGLGSDFTFPLSLCCDSRGIYYDAHRESDLEAALNLGPVTPGQAARAAHLRERLVALNITKYNLPGRPPDDLRARAAGRRLVLVLGQVPDDFSIQLGRALPQGNLDLVRRVRAENQGAFLIFKEHPDVVSGNRQGLNPPDALGGLADLVLHAGDTAQWIAACDDVHIMTSLAGFEALLRGKTVTCWGAPFYSGWGLTQDRVETGRRNAHLGLDDLIWRVMFDYALYRLPGSWLPATPEEALDEIERLRASPPRLPDKGAKRVVLRALTYLSGQARGLSGR